MKPLEKKMTDAKTDDKIQRPATHPWKKSPAVNRTAGQLRTIERTFGGRLPDPRF